MLARLRTSVSWLAYPRRTAATSNHPLTWFSHNRSHLNYESNTQPQILDLALTLTAGSIRYEGTKVASVYLKFFCRRRRLPCSALSRLIVSSHLVLSFIFLSHIPLPSRNRFLLFRIPATGIPRPITFSYYTCILRTRNEKGTLPFQICLIRKQVARSRESTSSASLYSKAQYLCFQIPWYFRPAPSPSPRENLNAVLRHEYEKGLYLVSFRDGLQIDHSLTET